MLILDFDGVLINSIDEVTLTVYNAATGKLVTTLAALPKFVCFNTTVFMSSPLEMQFC
jgi:hypothetical protein